MKNKKLVHGLLTAMLFAATPAFALQYKITLLDLGIVTEAYAINDHGQVVGYSMSADSLMSAFLWENGNATLLHTGSNSLTGSGAYALNNLGQVVGYADSRTTLWHADSATPLSNLNDAQDISNQGQVVGASGAGNSFHATLWENGTLTNLSGLSRQSWAFAINNHGDIVGHSYTSAGINHIPTLWSNGEITNLGTLGGNMGISYDINDLGQIVGESSTSGEQFRRATLWENGNIVDLGTLSGTGDSIANGINNLGQIVGSSAGYAALWQNGEIFNLNDLFVDLPLSMVSAQDINDSGQIVGWGKLANHNGTVSIILTPVPEPSAYVMLLLGLGLLGWSAFRKKKQI